MLTKQELTTTRYLTGPQVCTRYYRYELVAVAS
jgi:hypothetical protein